MEKNWPCLFIIISLFLINGCAERPDKGLESHMPEIVPEKVNESAKVIPVEKIEEQENKYQNQENSNEKFIISSPTNLTLPFDAENMFGGNKFVTPFGLIRHERDQGHGHAGIDIPLSLGDPLYAVSDGEIIRNEPASDGPGNNIILLIITDRAGEGWAFLYEHINLNFGIEVGSKARKGQLIGQSALVEGNNHLGLVYYFNNFKYTKEPKCWTEHLRHEDKRKLFDSWEKIRSNPTFIEGWQNAFEDGTYAYRALLNKDKFPSGPQLCYEYGLDVREFK